MALIIRDEKKPLNQTLSTDEREGIMGKKNKNEIAKRRERAKQQKRAKPKRVAVKSKPKTDVQFVSRPAFSDIEAPEGFRPISMTQGMMEYAKPIMAFFEEGSIEEMNMAMQLATLLWNYGITLERAGEEARREGEEAGGGTLEKIKNETVQGIKAVLNMNDKEATDFFDKMIKRKAHLFPPEIQPKYPTIMFMRKEVGHIIPEFNYSRLTLAKELVPPDNKDSKLIESINLMDRYILDRVDPGKWEKHYFLVEEQCGERFHQWLEDKGLQEFSEDFPFCIEAYLNFVYRYMHDYPIGLKTIPPVYMEEFFSDFLLRKYMVDPNEYVQWPPAIKLFYIFLSEKGYLENPEPFIQVVDEIEPHFIDLLRKTF
jgi:hypothetical protein